MRKGLASQISVTDDLGAGTAKVGTRPEIKLGLKFLAGSQTVDQLKSLHLIGPGDIVGIHSAQIVRTEPRQGVNGFEPNFFPFVEFYDEDFPWRHTPATPAIEPQSGEKLLLRPWLTLLVLRQDEFLETARRALLSSIFVTNTEALPPPRELHLWAHAHSNLNLGSLSDYPAFLDGLSRSRQDPDGLYSRILCPRRLEANLLYYAFLVPTFECGRLAGLDLPTGNIDALTPAWTDDGAEATIEFPVYYRWMFRTGDVEGFEELARKLKPQQLDPKVGTRELDCSTPGFRLADGSGEVPPPNPLMPLLEGALRHLDQNTPMLTPPLQPFTKALSDLANLGISSFNLPLNEVNDQALDPVVSIPFYGVWHTQRVPANGPPEPLPQLNPSQTGWLHELNRDPRWRAVAGMGAEVVRRHQEDFMDRAWDQLADLEAVNRKQRLTRFAIEINRPLFNKTVGNLSATSNFAAVIAFAWPTTSRVGTGANLSSGSTVLAQIRASQIPAAVCAAPLQRLLRSGGALDRKMGANTSKNFQFSSFFGKINATLKPLNPAPVIAVQAILPSFSSIGLTNTWVVNNKWWISNLNPEYKLYLNGNISFGPRGLGSSVSELEIKRAIQNLNQRFKATDPVETRSALAPDVGSKLAAALSPEQAHFRRFQATVKLQANTIPASAKLGEDLNQVLVAPDFPEATYRYLVERDPELMLPNLSLIPDNSFAVMRINPRFIQSYLVGFNHEMAAELLWREFPTDRRGTYFRQFWEVREQPDAGLNAQKDIKPIHRWEMEKPLDQWNSDRLVYTKNDSLVVVMRSDLLKKFPNAIVYAQKAIKNDLLHKNPPAVQIQLPAFGAELGDIRLLGFNLTASQATGKDRTPGFPGNDTLGWYFVIAEAPGDPRFGMDLLFNLQAGQPLTWDALAWDRIDVAPGAFVRAGQAPRKPDGTPWLQAQEPDINGNEVWTRSSADMAGILLQKPVMIAIHAKELIP